MTTVICALVVLMIVGALVAIETDNLLLSIISLGAVGFLLSIVFLFLSAPDLAITQMAVEVITLVILLKATHLSTRKTTDRKPNIAMTVSVVCMLGVLVLVGSRMFAEFPDFGDPVMARFADAPSSVYLQEGLEKTGAPNIVTAVLLDFRAYDTLGEAAVLFCAIMGAQSVLRRRSHKNLQAEGES